MFVKVDQEDRKSWTVSIVDDSTIIPDVILVRRYDKEEGALRFAREILCMDTLTNLNPR